MAYTEVNGTYLPPRPEWSATSFATGLTIDATGEKAACIGNIVWPSYSATKAIRKLQFMFGAVTKAGGSSLTLSLQNVSTSAGLPAVPDETQDETVAIANADAGFASNTWYTTGNLSADRTVSYGDPLAVVLEFDGGGRLGADSVIMRSVTKANLWGGSPSWPACSLKTASWATVGAAPNIVFEFSDGTFGKFQGSWPVSEPAVTASFKQDTGTADEYALEIPVPFNCKVSGAYVLAGATAATADYDVVLYDGTTAMTGGTVSRDGNWHTTASERRPLEIVFTQEITLTAGTTYRLSVKPTQTTSNVSIAMFDVNAAGHMALHPLGTSCVLTTRLDSGSWAAVTTTRRPIFGLIVSAVDAGSGGTSGGQLISG